MEHASHCKLRAGLQGISFKMAVFQPGKDAVFPVQAALPSLLPWCGHLETPPLLHRALRSLQTTPGTSLMAVTSHDIISQQHCLPCLPLQHLCNGNGLLGAALSNESLPTAQLLRLGTTPLLHHSLLVPFSCTITPSRYHSLECSHLWVPLPTALFPTGTIPLPRYC